MAMQTDVESTQPLAATGVFKTQGNADCTFRTRIRGVYALCGASAGSVVITDGQAGATSDALIASNQLNASSAIASL